MKVKSFAKINLGLEILRKREDNYHEIRTLFQSIDFYDVLEFTEIDGNKIILFGNDNSIPWNENNLIFKAASLLKNHCHIDRGIEIKVKKQIPPGKGLAGGSSNAALTFLALNKIWNLNLSKWDLMNLAKQLGADIPYFFYGGLALGLERGDEIHPLIEENSFWVLLVLPDFSISTKEIYSHWSEATLTSKFKESKINKFLKERIYRSLENDLEEIIFNLYPELKKIKQILRDGEAELALVSGTGSSVYGLFKDKNKAQQALAEFKNQNLKRKIVSTISRAKYGAEIGNF